MRHGDVSNWLTSDAFDLRSARSLEAEAAVEKARALLREGEAASLHGLATVDKELRGVLADLDPFWVRWSAFLEQRRQGKRRGRR